MRQLLQSPLHEYVLAGDAVDPYRSGIPEWVPADPRRVVRTRCRFYVGGLMTQTRVIGLALRSSVNAIVFQGDVHFLTTWLAAAVARLRGKRVLFWTIGWLRSESGVKALVRRSFYRLAHGLLLYGHWAKQEGLRHGFQPDTLHVIYNSLDYPSQREARQQATSQTIVRMRRELFGTAHRPMVICVSRLTAKRRLDLLLHAAALLKREGHEINTLLVGDGPERPALDAMAISLGLTVRFYGECYEEQKLAQLLMAANVTVAPGMVGLTAMQSLAYGTPVVTHDDWNRQAPEWEAVLPGKNGSLFKYGDISALADAIRGWTGTELPSEDVRKRCYEIIDRFYNPEFQRHAIDRAVAGEPADDLFWMRDGSAGRPA